MFRVFGQKQAFLGYEILRFCLQEHAKLVKNTSHILYWFY